MAKDYAAMAQQILDKVGGEQNVALLEHCSTRLRFKLADTAKTDTAALQWVSGVAGVNPVDGGMQA